MRSGGCGVVQPVLVGRRERGGGRQEMKTGTQLPDMLPKPDLHTPWRAGSPLSAPAGLVGRSGLAGSVQRPS